jgi:hypothetical protein
MTNADLGVKSLAGPRRRVPRGMIELTPIKRQKKGGFLPR